VLSSVYDRVGMLLIA